MAERTVFIIIIIFYLKDATATKCIKRIAAVGDIALIFIDRRRRIVSPTLTADFRPPAGSVASRRAARCGI